MRSAILLAIIFCSAMISRGSLTSVSFLGVVSQASNDEIKIKTFSSPPDGSSSPFGALRASKASFTS